MKTSFHRLSSLFVEHGIKAITILRAGHVYCEELSVVIQENQCQASSHYVCRYTRELGEFEVEENANPHIGRRIMVCTVKLREWWCDCDKFQALGFPCSQVIAACQHCNLDYNMFIDPIYRLDYIAKV